jgi:hypothetical protein
VSILEDVNQTIFPVVDDVYGREVYADSRGITFYKGQYYRADVVTFDKSYQIYNKHVSPKSPFTSYEERSAQTITRSYSVVSLASLPVANSYPITMSFFDGYTPFYFSGSLNMSGAYGLVGAGALSSSRAHTLTGTVYGKISGIDPRSLYNPSAWIPSTINSPGLQVTATFSSASIALPPVSSSVVFTGNFSMMNGIQMFSGTVSYIAVVPRLSTLANYNTMLFSTGSIFDQLRASAYGPLFGPIGSGISYRKEISMTNYPENSALLIGYHFDHYKNGKKEFSQKIVNSIDSNGAPFKWKKNSQTITTTVDPSSGLLNNSQPVEIATT